MNIAIDVSPLKSSRFLQHRVRGTGFYIENLKRSLLQYYPKNKYIFFTRGKNLLKPSIYPIDLVHYPYFEPFFLTLPIFNSYRTIVTVHDLTPIVFPKYFPKGIKGAIKWQIQKMSLRKTDAIITDSKSSKEDIVRYANIPREKIHVVYLAASSAFKKMKKTLILESIKEKYNLPEKFVLYVGDVTWNKNLPRLIEAIKKINLTLVMVGKALMEKDFDRTNPWNQDLVKVQKLIHNDKRIIRLGFVPTEDLIMLYNLASVFVMPSVYEGFGLPILEAMSCGCPVVTSKEGSISEIAGDAAFYVDPYDINDIANGIGEVYLNQKLQRELSYKGLIQAEKFSWKKTAEETMRVYNLATS